MDKRTKSQPFSLLLMEESKLYVCKITDLFSLILHIKLYLVNKNSLRKG